MSRINDYPLTIAASSEEEINVDAEAFACTGANLDFFLVCINDGPEVEFRRQFEYEAPADQPIRKLKIKNPSSTSSLVVRLKVWRGLFRDRRSIANDVGGLFPRTISEIQESSFSTHGNNPADPTLFRYHGVYNKANSGVVIGVVGATVSCVDGNGFYRLRTAVGDPAAAGLTTGTNVDTRVIGSGQMPNGFELIFGTIGAVPAGFQHGVLACPQHDSREYKGLRSNPIILLENTYLFFATDSANMELRPQFDVIEVAR